MRISNKNGMTWVVITFWNLTRLKKWTAIDGHRVPIFSPVIRWLIPPICITVKTLIGLECIYQRDYYPDNGGVNPLWFPIRPCISTTDHPCLAESHAPSTRTAHWPQRMDLLLAQDQYTNEIATCYDWYYIYYILYIVCYIHILYNNKYYDIAYKFIYDI